MYFSTNLSIQFKTTHLYLFSAIDFPINQIDGSGSYGSLIIGRHMISATSADSTPPPKHHQVIPQDRMTSLCSILYRYMYPRKLQDSVWNSNGVGNV